MCIELYKEIYHQTHVNMRFLSHRDRTTVTPGNRKPTRNSRTPVHKGRGLLSGVCAAGKARAGNRRKWKSKQQNKESVTLSLQSPGRSLLWPNLVQASACLWLVNAHLLPLIKGIIIYNFLLKNQLCILSIAGRNSPLVTWLENTDQNSSLWKEKKAVLKLFIYRHKKPCCRAFANYEDFLQCIKIKDFLKIIALGFQTHMPPICKPRGFCRPRVHHVCTHSEGCERILAPTEKSREEN